MQELYKVKNGVMRAVSYFDGELVEFTRCGSRRLKKGNAVCIDTDEIRRRAWLKQQGEV